MGKRGSWVENVKDILLYSTLQNNHEGIWLCSSFIKHHPFGQIRPEWGAQCFPVIYLLICFIFTLLPPHPFCISRLAKSPLLPFLLIALFLSITCPLPMSFSPVALFSFIYSPSLLFSISLCSCSSLPICHLVFDVLTRFYSATAPLYHSFPWTTSSNPSSPLFPFPWFHDFFQNHQCTNLFKVFSFLY